jgi:hypothetical protein
MRFDRTIIFALLVFLFTGCGGGGGGGSGGSSNSRDVTIPIPEGGNVLLVTVNGSLCSKSNSYLNKPCVSVTVCGTDGTSTCQTITDILLDTGSSGLRIFKQALNNDLSFEQVTLEGSSLAECVQYGDGSSHWGPIQMAAVKLGDEPEVLIPIQVIDAGFGSRDTGVCTGAEESPEKAMFNGILGIGYWVQDCGLACRDNGDIGWYYLCDESQCVKTVVPLENQVQNPVAILASDNNGFYVRFPEVPTGGSPSADGYLILGIDTRSNNIPPTGIITYPVDDIGEFTTTFSGNSYQRSFADTGSNGLFFGSPPNSLPLCQDYDPWFCPSSTTTFSATTIGAGGSPSGAVSLEIANFSSLVTSGNKVFRNIGADPFFFDSGLFDWGLPFFLGRTVYIGIEGRSSILGTGPYIAY